MSTFLLIVHSWLRWAVLITALWTIIRAIRGISSQSVYTAADNKSNLFFMISCDLQFLAGILLYFLNGWAAGWTGDTAAVMSDKMSRFFTVEHAGIMIVAWIIVHIGRSVVKKTPSDRQKHKKSLAYFGIALLLILLAVPWPFRAGLGYHPWFRF